MPRGLLPAALTYLLLGAHFLRMGNIPVVLLLIVCIALLMVQRAWAHVVTSTVLGLGVLVWALTIYGIASIRMANDEPWIRMAVIMSAVLVLNLWALIRMRHPKTVAWFRSGPAGPNSAPEPPATP